MGSRAEARERTTAAILAAARRQIAQQGAGSLSMRAVAREVGMVSSAVFRYFPTRDTLLTAMILESYGHLDAALAAVDPGGAPGAHWIELGTALRAWAVANPHEFQLLYGTPVPGYAAPPQTIPAATAVARHFLSAGAHRPVPGFGGVPADQLRPLAGDLGLDPSGAAAVLTELAALVGSLTLELAGHLVGTADPADHLYAALLHRQTHTLGLTSRRAP